MSDTVNLGRFLTGDESRDAIHIAIAPVVAGEKLAPGQDIGFLSEGSPDVGVTDNPVGIVDPFLKNLVFPGQVFYMMLYPNTITSLRHDWTHPAFEEAKSTKSTKEESEDWLRHFCKTHDCPSYETVLAAVKGEHVNVDGDYYGQPRLNSDYFHFDGVDAHSDIPPEFWDHMENVIGKPCDDRPSSFSCMC